MRLSGRSCCEGKYDRYKVYKTQESVLREGGDPDKDADYTNTYKYYLIKTAFKAQGPYNPDFYQAGTRYFDQGFNSYTDGTWSVLIDEFVVEGSFQELEGYNIVGNEIIGNNGISNSNIHVYANATDEYAYIWTRYIKQPKLIVTTFPDGGYEVTYEGESKNELRLIKVHINTKTVLYNKKIDLKFGELTVREWDSEKYDDSPFNYKLKEPVKQFPDVPGNNLMLTTAGLVMYLSLGKMYLCNIQPYPGGNTNYRGNDHPDYNPQNFDYLPYKDISNRAFVLIEIDCFTGEVKREIIDWASYVDTPRPVFFNSKLIQDPDNILGMMCIKGHPEDGGYHRCLIVTGKLDLSSGKPEIVDYTVIKEHRYLGGQPAWNGTPTTNQYSYWTSSGLQIHWGQDVGKHTYVSIHNTFIQYNAPPGQIVGGTYYAKSQFEIFQNGAKVFDKFYLFQDSPYYFLPQIYVEPCFLDGYIIVTAKTVDPLPSVYVPDIQLYNTFICYKSDNTPVWDKTYADQEVGSGPYILSYNQFWDFGSVLANDHYVGLFDCPVKFSEQITEDDVKIDSNFKYTEYIYDYGNSNIMYSFFLNVRYGFFMPKVMVADPETDWNFLGTYRDENGEIYPEYKDKISYESLSRNTGFDYSGFGPQRLNFIRLTGLPDSYFPART